MNVTYVHAAYYLSKQKLLHTRSVAEPNDMNKNELKKTFILENQTLSGVISNVNCLRSDERQKSLNEPKIKTIKNTSVS